MEMLVSVGVLGLILTSVGLVQMRGESSSKAMRARDIAESRARRALDRVAAEMTGVGRSLVFPDPSTSFGASTLTYQRPTGVNAAGVTVWGTQSKLELRLDPREIDNGIDDDHDGLVDERELVLTRDFGTPNARTIVLCRNIPKYMPGEVPNGLDDNGNGVVDEAGFNVRRVGDLLTIRLAVQQPFSGNQVATAVIDTAIVLHN